MKVAYAGFDLLSPCLCALEQAGCEVMQIFTYPTDQIYEFNRDVVTFAKRRGIPWTDQRITSEDLYRLLACGCQALISAGYIYKIPVDTPMRCVNVHPALLPVGRGPWPMPCTILRGCKESGVTVHKVAAGFDTGDILAQEAFPVTEHDTLETMTDQIRLLAPQVLRRVVDDFDRRWDAAVPQGPGEYWPEPTQAEMTFYATDSAQRVDRVVRAFAGYGSIFCLKRQEIGVLHGEVCFADHNQEPGTICIEEGVPMYALNGGWLRVRERGQQGECSDGGRYSPLT